MALVRFGFSRVPHKSSLLLIASAVVVYLNNSRREQAARSKPLRTRFTRRRFLYAFLGKRERLSSLPMPVLPWIVLIKYSGFDFRRRLRIFRAIYRGGYTHRGVKVPRTVCYTGPEIYRVPRGLDGNWLLEITRSNLKSLERMQFEELKN